MGVVLGFTLGALNVFVIACAIGVQTGDAGDAVLVMGYGILPGLVAGSILGGVGTLMRDAPRLVRAAVLIAPAIGVVMVLADVFGMTSLVLPACIPTIVAALLLERGTRAPALSTMPTARAM